MRGFSPPRDLLAPILPDFIYGLFDEDVYLVIDSGASLHVCNPTFASDYPLYQENEKHKNLYNASGKLI